MIIKAHQVISIKNCILFSLIFFFNCQNKTHKKEEIAIAKTEIVAIKIPKSDLILKPNTGLVYYQNQPFSGTSILRYSNGNKAESANYKSGIKDGILRKWFKDGSISFEAFYVNNQLEGVSKSWWINGNLRTESHFIKGIANGTQKQWYKTGELFKQLTIVDGKEEGMQKAWRRNGKIYNNYEAKNGRIFGLKRANLCFQLEEEIVQNEKF